jgi:hypothetical protein
VFLFHVCWKPCRIIEIQNIKFDNFDNRRRNQTSSSKEAKNCAYSKEGRK